MDLHERLRRPVVTLDPENSADTPLWFQALRTWSRYAVVGLIPDPTTVAASPSGCHFTLLAGRQRDPLKHLCLCRIAVNRVSQTSSGVSS